MAASQPTGRNERRMVPGFPGRRAAGQPGGPVDLPVLHPGRSGRPARPRGPRGRVCALGCVSLSARGYSVGEYDQKAIRGRGGVRRGRCLATLAALGLSFSVLGCQATGAKPKAAQKGPPKRDTRVVHEPCPISGPNAERLDGNGDGRADVTIVRRNGREACRAFDLNFDGKVDSWVYFDAEGRVRRRERDYDRDGFINEISVYQAGGLKEQTWATRFPKRLDTWRYFEAGRLTRTERDSNGDAVIDEWWEHRDSGCALVHVDTNGDGYPDPGLSVDHCKEPLSVPAPAAEGPRRGPSFERVGELPTEVVPSPEAAPAEAAPSNEEGSTKTEGGP